MCSDCCWIVLVALHYQPDHPQNCGAAAAAPDHPQKCGAAGAPLTPSAIMISVNTFDYACNWSYLTVLLDDMEKETLKETPPCEIYCQTTNLYILPLYKRLRTTGLSLHCHLRCWEFHSTTRKIYFKIYHQAIILPCNTKLLLFIQLSSSQFP